MASAVDFSKKTLVVVTGASQGIGRTLAIEFTKRLTNRSVIILIARSETGLLETKSNILEQSKNADVKLHSLDLSGPDVKVYDDIFNLCLDDIEQAVIFHNVGCVGELNVTTELINLQAWRDYFDLNVFSVGILNSVFVRKLRGQIDRLVVINITSLLGREAFNNTVMYGTGKAAREMYFKVFAEEEPNITVLNYSPGPVETAMVDEMIENLKCDSMKQMFVELKEKKTILTAEQTVGKLLGILEEGDFKSGAVIDYYDRIKN